LKLIGAAVRQNTGADDPSGDDVREPGDQVQVHIFAVFEKAVELEQPGDLEEAARTYRGCLFQSGPEFGACFNLANVLSDLGQTEAAVELYRQAVEIELNVTYLIAIATRL
jgi:tetratricopeptide (TPR) repeat protein